MAGGQGSKLTPVAPLSVFPSVGAQVYLPPDRSVQQTASAATREKWTPETKSVAQVAYLRCAMTATVRHGARSAAK